MSLNFQERFKGKIQKMPKDGISSLLSNEGSKPHTNVFTQSKPKYFPGKQLKLQNQQSSNSKLGGTMNLPTQQSSSSQQNTQNIFNSQTNQMAHHKQNQRKSEKFNKISGLNNQQYATYTNSNDKFSATVNFDSSPFLVQNPYKPSTTSCYSRNHQQYQSNYDTNFGNSMQQPSNYNHPQQQYTLSQTQQIHSNYNDKFNYQSLSQLPKFKQEEHGRTQTLDLNFKNQSAYRMQQLSNDKYSKDNNSFQQQKVERASRTYCNTLNDLKYQVPKSQGLGANLTEELLEKRQKQSVNQQYSQLVQQRNYEQFLVNKKKGNTLQDNNKENYQESKRMKALKFAAGIPKPPVRKQKLKKNEMKQQKNYEDENKYSNHYDSVFNSELDKYELMHQQYKSQLEKDLLMNY